MAGAPGAERLGPEWADLTTEHADPGAVLWSWAQSYLGTDLLPERRVVVRFDFHNRGRRNVWLLVRAGR